MLERAKRHWSTLTQFAAFVMLQLGFLRPPEVVKGKDDTALLARFIVTVVVALLVIAGVIWSKRRHLRSWTIAATVMLVAACAMFIRYREDQRACTCDLRGKPVLIGTVLTDQAKIDIATNKVSTCAELIDGFESVDEIWTSDSIAHAETLLTIEYLSAVVLFALVLLMAIHAVSIVSRGSTTL